MAFFSKVGNILRQTASRRISCESSVSNLSIYQAIRCMSSSKVFIGGLSYSMDDNILRETCAKYGYVNEARIIMDRESGRSRGFGFVTFSSAEEASSAIQALDGQELLGRRIKVNYANERPAGGYRGGGGYGGDYGGGSYGGGGSGYGGGYGGGRSASYDGAGDSVGGGGYGGGSGNYGVAGGAGGTDGGYVGNTGFGNFSGSSGGINAGFAGSTGAGFGGSDESGSSMGGAAGGFDQNGPLDGNFRDDDNDDGDFAKRA